MESETIEISNEKLDIELTVGTRVSKDSRTHHFLDAPNGCLAALLVKENDQWRLSLPVESATDKIHIEIADSKALEIIEKTSERNLTEVTV